MLRQFGTGLVALISASCFLVVTAPPSTAATGDDCPDLTCSADDPQVDTSSGGGRIAVHLEVTGAKSGGGTYRTTSTIHVAPACWYTRWMSGKEYADLWTSQTYQDAIAQMPEQYRTTALPNWQEHADDDEGGWYGPRCRDSAPTLTQYEYSRSHPPIWLDAGQPAPATREDVAPEVLAQAAFEAMNLPTGTIRWNPSLTGTAATVVNLDTWVWVQDAPTTASVTATVPSGTWATVTAQVDHVRVSAPGATTVTCPDLGTPYTAGATHTTCAIRFYRSSANQAVKTGHTQPTATMTIAATWTASWVSSLDPDTPTALPSQDLTTTTEIPVAEIQRDCCGFG